MRIPSTLSPAEQDALARRAAAGEHQAERALLDSHRVGVCAWATRVGLDPTRELVRAVLDELGERARDPERGFDYTRGYVLGLWGFGFVREALSELANHASRCAALAVAGDLDALMDEARSDRARYRWLHLARDAGHEQAQDLLSELEESSELRYDDGATERAAAHYRLALDYLHGFHGIARDLERARAHLNEAFAFRPGREVLAELERANGEIHDVEAAQAGLDDEARGVLAEALAGSPTRCRID